MRTLNKENLEWFDVNRVLAIGIGRDKCWKLCNKAAHRKRLIRTHTLSVEWIYWNIKWIPARLWHRNIESRTVYLSNTIPITKFENSLGALFFGANLNWQYNFMRKMGISREWRDFPFFYSFSALHNILICVFRSILSLFNVFVMLAILPVCPVLLFVPFWFDYTDDVWAVFHPIHIISCEGNNDNIHRTLSKLMCICVCTLCMCECVFVFSTNRSMYIFFCRKNLMCALSILPIFRNSLRQWEE